METNDGFLKGMKFHDKNVVVDATLTRYMCNNNHNHNYYVDDDSN